MAAGGLTYGVGLFMLARTPVATELSASPNTFESVR
jgi:hypothetical protein